MKGIILAGGSGTRLYPLTKIFSKQLLPIYDKPMIFYPLSTLMLAGVRDILIISTPQDIGKFNALIGNGDDYGIKISYEAQEYPNGLAEAFIIGEKFIGNQKCVLILGDNLFFGANLKNFLKKAVNNKNGATIFAYPVKDPNRYGIVEFNKKNEVISIEEKPKYPKSIFAVTGLYFYDNKVIDFSKKLKPSSRGELEITDINIEYMKIKELKVLLLGRGMTWLDTGTHESLLEASQFVNIIEKRQGLKIACLEEIAFRNKFISESHLKSRAKLFKNSEYGKYLKTII